MSSVFVCTLGCVSFVDTLFPAALSTHIHRIGFYVPSFAGDIMWTGKLLVASILLQLLV